MGTVALFWLLGGLLGGAEPDACAAAEQTARATFKVIESEWPLRSPNDLVSRYVQRLGEGIAVAGLSPSEQRPWTFVVVRNREPTAFALGGNRCVISDGLIAFVRDESQLAAVLAHEIAHQRLGHFCTDSSRTERRTRLGGLTQHYDRSYEYAADTLARDLLATAGFDPAAMASVLRCLMAVSGGSVADLGARSDALSARAEAVPWPVSSGSTGFDEARQLVLDDFAAIGDLPPVCP